MNQKINCWGIHPTAEAVGFLSPKYIRKGIIKKTESTPLTKVMSYLARYGNDDTVAYLTTSLFSEENESKQKFYAQALDYINRFGFDRLMKLALAIHLNHYIDIR